MNKIMYYIQRWPKGEIMTERVLDTVAQHEIKQVATILLDVLEVTTAYQGRVISEYALKREGGQGTVDRAKEQAKQNEAEQTSLWKALQSSSNLSPLAKLKDALRRLHDAQIITEDEIHRAHVDGHSFRHIAGEINLSHERVRQIYNDAQERLFENHATCAHGHEWKLYEYHFGFYPTECPTCQETFTQISEENPGVKIPYRSSVDIVPIKDIVEGEQAYAVRHDGTFLSIIKINPIAFEMRSSQEQENLLSDWAEFLEQIDHPIQVICHTKKLSTEAYKKQFIDRAAKDQNLPEKATELIAKHLENLDKAGEFYDKEFYLILQMPKVEEKGKRKLFTKTPYDKESQLQQLLILIQSVEFYFTRMGIEISHLNAKEILELYYELYHPNLKPRKEDQ